MSRTAFIARPRSRQATTHYTGHAWTVTYEGKFLGFFRPSSTQSVQTMLADRGIDIASPNVHVEFVGYTQE